MRSIAVVGGGTAGWMTATHLSRLLPDVSLVMVEPAHSTPIGVGEATIPMVRTFMARAGFTDEAAWMARCNATYKAGILFEGWRKPASRYWHPFDPLEYLDGETHVGHVWMHDRSDGDPPLWSFYEACFPSTTTAVAHDRAPLGASYAYHFDADELGLILKEACRARVQLISGDVVHVERAPDGRITSLRTSAGDDVTADLYVDCTGFRRVLAGTNPRHAAEESFATSLLCDRAVVGRVRYASDEDKRRLLVPYVRAEAATAGWIWSIPLFDKLSTGYVFSSAFLDPMVAEDELRSRWGEALTGEVRTIGFASSKLVDQWHDNVVAVGLAGGFVEPLESSGLAITQIAIELLGSVLDGRYYDSKIVRRYNAHLDKIYLDTVDFLVAHYLLTARDDSAFWKANRHDLDVSDSLRARLEVFHRLLPSIGTKSVNELWMFRDVSWLSVLLGMGFEFAPVRLAPSTLGAGQLLLMDLRRRTERALERAPDHLAYLSEAVHCVG